MKAVLTGHIPPQSFSEEANNITESQNRSEPVENNQLGSKTLKYELRNTVQRQVRQNLNLNMESAAPIYTGDNLRTSALNRRGKAMKAGPSKSVRRPRKSELYIGKLSNVVQFKRRRWASETGSDADSVIYY